MQQIEIRVRGQIDKEWSDCFGGLGIAHTDQGETVMTGSVPDQAALHGLLSKLQDLGLELLSVTVQGQSYKGLRK
jgi:hypothetical protein